ncbi:hypothetical protein D3C71_1465320 [compost metagenome]
MYQAGLLRGEDVANNDGAQTGQGGADYQVSIVAFSGRLLDFLYSATTVDVSSAREQGNAEGRNDHDVFLRLFVADDLDDGSEAKSNSGDTNTQFRMTAKRGRLSSLFDNHGGISTGESGQANEMCKLIHDITPEISWVYSL